MIHSQRSRSKCSTGILAKHLSESLGFALIRQQGTKLTPWKIRGPNHIDTRGDIYLSQICALSCYYSLSLSEEVWHLVAVKPTEVQRHWFHYFSYGSVSRVLFVLSVSLCYPFNGVLILIYFLVQESNEGDEKSPWMILISYDWSNESVALINNLPLVTI